MGSSTELKAFIILIIALVIGVAFVAPIYTNFVAGMPLGTTRDLFAAIPIVIAFFVLIWIAGFLCGDEDVDESEVSYYVEPTYVEKGIKVKDAKKILKIRFAKGEINSFEYTERMSRL